MRVALAQINPTSADIDGNAAKILEAVAAAAAERADIVVTPELALPGYCIGDLVEDTAFLAANERALQGIAAGTRGITAVVGFIDCDAGATNDHGTVRKYNAAAVVRDGRVLQRARKSLLPSYRYFDDKRYLSPGERREPVEVTEAAGPLSRVGVSICEDLWDEYYDVKPLPELAAKGAGLILNLNASPFYPGKRHTRQKLIREHIDRLHCPIAYVNTVGAADNGKNIIPFDGESLVLRRRRAPGGDRAAVRGRPAHRRSGSRPAARAAGAPSGRAGARDVRRARHVAPRLHAEDRIHAGGRGRLGRDRLGAGARDRRRCAGPRLCEGVQPAVETQHRHYADRSRSAWRPRLVCAIPVIPIQQIDDDLRAVFERHAHPIEQGFTRENLHARIRGILMMAESNDTGALLISCGNETEIALGYATLYGDMCGGMSLIGDLSKTDVYGLSRYVNRKHGREMIPNETFTIKPSAELAAGQFDPFDYAVVAPIVGEFVERRTSPGELVRQFERRALDPARFKPDDEGRTPYDKYTSESFRAIVDDAFRRMRRSVYKRMQGPPIVVVSERAFGFDLRETIINGWNG